MIQPFGTLVRRYRMCTSAKDGGRRVITLIDHLSCASAQNVQVCLPHGSGREQPRGEGRSAEDHAL